MFARRSEYSNSIWYGNLCSLNLIVLHDNHHDNPYNADAQYWYTEQIALADLASRHDTLYTPPACVRPLTGNPFCRGRTKSRASNHPSGDIASNPPQVGLGACLRDNLNKLFPNPN